MNISKEFLSASTNGRPVAITGTTSGAADTIHTAVSGTSSKDEVWLYASNTTSSAVIVTLCFGGTGTSDQLPCVVPAYSTVQIAPGVPLNNSLVVKAFAGTASAVNVTGFAHRLS